MEADHAAGAEAADLDEVAELVGHPQAPAAVLGPGRALAADEGVVVAAEVGDLADQRVVGEPGAQGADAAAVADAVGRRLVDREDELFGALGWDARLVGLAQHFVAEGG